MPGGLIQLVAYGVEDLYLTGEPQITFFKILYRRHTNFSVESVMQHFSSIANFGESVSCTISRSGDLVGKIFLYAEIPSLPKFINQNTGEEDHIKKIAWVNNLGYALIQDITIEIGGKIIDKQYGEWMYIWSQVSNRQNESLDKMLGNVPKIYEFSNGKAGYQLYIPLEFWFCRNTGLYLPLISLASSDIKLNINFRRLEECYRIGPTHSLDILEDIIPFKHGDYIEQTIKGYTIYGYVIDYDFLQKKLYYIKINNPSSNKNTFEAYQYAICGIKNNINDNNNIPKDVLHNTNYVNNVEYRIYNCKTKSFCTPKPNSREMIEQTNLQQKIKLGNCFLYVDYVYLDNDERNKFSKSNHEYLIEQIQFNQELFVKSSNVKMNLALNHPCKAFYWVAQLDGLVGPGTINDIFNYTESYTNANIGIVDRAIMYLNGKERFSERSWKYFNLVEPYQHHYRGPNIGINVYSPSINPEEHQPSSAINMSKIDDITMQMKLSNSINSQNTAKIRLYTINYNVLRICFNMAGLVFA